MKRGHAPFWFFGLLPLLSVTWTGCGRTPSSPADAAPPAVTVSQPIEREVVDYNTFTGMWRTTSSVGSSPARRPSR